ncbi:hypothetical protein D9758_003303 [Tetrapyrgos nigripes]|uniref:Uncharacterized protein n=1 Tax=Tetrapyrgos nigripes TaxID=182062 RepID=A0A8H5LQL3_9AGAR|nr:hypothetical protein D9758_003303 [Tetrapyrgos nigripes]
MLTVSLPPPFSYSLTMYQATDNLRTYLREAALPKMENDRAAPKMPAPSHKSHLNDLKVRPEVWRRLESIYILHEYCALEKTVTAWMDDHVPGTSLGIEDEDNETGDIFSIPCQETIFHIPYSAERRPNNILRQVALWRTVQRTLHVLYPDTSKWVFKLDDDNDLDRKILQHFTWTLPWLEYQGLSADDISRIERASVVVAFQPPWILSPQDIKEFARCRSFPAYRAPGNAFAIEDLRSEERAWAKLWDICVTKKTPWFVLTSYNQWVFGMFTQGWTAAFVTKVYEYNSFEPTIVELLTFWIASAMGISTFQCPKVPEPVHLPPAFVTPLGNVAHFEAPAISESNWDGKSMDAASSAGVFRSVSPVLSEDGLDERPIPVERLRNLDMDMVQSWKRTLCSSLGSPAISNRRAPLAEHVQDRGDWLV